MADTVMAGWYIGQTILSSRPYSFSGWARVLLKDENGHVDWRDVPEYCLPPAQGHA